MPTDDKPIIFPQQVKLQTSSNADSIRDPRIMALLWGGSGFGKTTLAATFPGKKLLLNFDPGGPDSIRSRIDAGEVDLLDFSDSTKEIANEFKSADNPFNLRAIIGNYDTLILDSLTTVAERATDYGISITKGATIERPSPGAYGARNALVLALVQSVMRLCVRHDVHLACIAHEKEVSNDEGSIVGTVVALGGQLPQNTALRFSEVWSCYNLGVNGTKTIGVRDGVRNRRPCKSRMFDVRSQMEFAWRFDPIEWVGDKMEDFYNQWEKSGYQKIKMPGAK